MRISNALCFDDVLIKPQYSEIVSRKEIDTTTDLGPGLSLKIPVISSPMDTVTEVEMAVKMSEAGGLGVIHRYNTPDSQALLVEKCVSRLATVGFAVGVGDDMLTRPIVTGKQQES